MKIRRISLVDMVAVISAAIVVIVAVIAPVDETIVPIVTAFLGIIGGFVGARTILPEEKEEEIDDGFESAIDNEEIENPAKVADDEFILE